MSRGLVQSDITGRKIDYELGRNLLLPATVSIYADVVEVKTPYSRPNSKPGKRGTVHNMSSGSRRRLIRYMAKVRGLEDAWFSTLTYPAEYSEDWRVWKKHLRAIVRRLERLFERLSAALAGIWRLEFQLRGAPHFHLLLLGLNDDSLLERAKADRSFMRTLSRYKELYPESRLDLENNWVHAFRAWLSQAWYEIVDSGDVKHLRAGVQADRVQSRKHAMYYVSKYVAKEDNRTQNKETGRVWGKFGEIDTAASGELVLPAYGMVHFRRTLAAYMKSKGRGKYGRDIKRGKLGFFVLGLGDSSDNGALIERMLSEAYDYAADRLSAIPGTVRYEMRERQRQEEYAQSLQAKLKRGGHNSGTI